MRVPQKLIEDSGVVWTFKGLEPKLGLSYTVHPDYASVILRPNMVETHFTRRDRPEPTREFVRQGKYECAPAALAILLDVTLKEAKQAYRAVGWKNSIKGATDKMTKQAAALLGCPLIKVAQPINRPCLIGLPSLNVKGVGHAVCWDGKEILDPNWGFPGRKWWGTEWGPETIGGVRFLFPYHPKLPQAEREELARLNVEMRRDDRLKEEELSDQVAKILELK